MVVIDDLPVWYACVSDNFGKLATVGRISQQIGVSGVIIVETEPVDHSSFK